MPQNFLRVINTEMTIGLLEGSFYHFCTYFDRNYLTRGLALYRSLEEQCRRSFVLWILCFDDETYENLMRLNLPSARLLRRNEFEANDAGLAKARTNRTNVEYFWTCTPSVLLFVLRRDPTIAVITYLDADLYFFSDPEPIFREFGDGSILIIGHRFAPEYAHLSNSSGIYNVGLLAVRRDSDGLRCLQWWRDRCIEWCFARAEDGKYGDQKYLDSWPERFQRVVVLQYQGAGLGPWNISACRPHRGSAGVEIDGKPLIFFHFHGLKCVSRNVVCLNEYPSRIDAVQLQDIYRPYVFHLKAAATFSRFPFADAFASNVSIVKLLQGMMNQTYFLIRPWWLSRLLWALGTPARMALAHIHEAQFLLATGKPELGRRHLLLALAYEPSLLLRRHYIFSMAKTFMGDAQVAFCRTVRDYLWRLHR